MKKRKIRLLVLTILTVLLPIAYEIVDAITGDWKNKEGEFCKVKIYAIIIIIIYLIIVIVNAVIEFNEKDAIDDLKKESGVLKKVVTLISDYMNYSNRGISKQSKYLAEDADVTIRELEIQGYATYVSKGIYEILTKIFGKEHLTVNASLNFLEGGKEQSLLSWTC